MINQIAKLEEIIFSDPWSYKTIEETLLLDYNRLYVIYMAEGNYIATRVESGFVENDIEISGYILANSIFGDSELLRIAVKENERGKGLALKLFEAYMSDTLNECDNYFLEVRQSNEVAQALYEKIGYSQIDVRKNYYSNPSENGIIYQLRKGRL